MMDYDETTAFLGQWGRFQQTVFFLLCASTIPNGFNVFSMIFLADIPRHHCLVPEVNLSQEWRNAIIPIEVVNGKEELSRCSRYRLDVVRNLSDQGFIPGRDVNVTELGKEGCLDGWSYSRDIYQSTIVTEFDLVCSEQWKQPFTSSVYFLGVLCGSFFSGQLSDRFGRKPVFFATMAVQTLFGFFQAFSTSWTVYSILFFVNGLGQISNYVAAFVLGSETLTGNIRVLFASVGVCLFFVFGYMMLPLTAYFIRDWRSLQLTLSLPGLVYIPFWWFIPESPRWLLSQGRVEEAEAILRLAAKKNKVEAPQVIFTDYDADMAKTQFKPEERHTVVDLVRTTNIRITTAIVCLVWFSLSIGYIALSLNTSRLHGDPYINCFISASIEIPAYISCWLALKYFPRRLSLAVTALLGGLSLYFIQLVPQSLPELFIALEMLGKFGIATGLAMIFVYSAELYPTVIRNTAMGACNTVSRMGSTISPYFMQLGMFHKYLPYILLGTLAVLSALATLFLPESFRRPLPETIQQMPKRQRIKWPCTTTEDDSPKPVVSGTMKDYDETTAFLGQWGRFQQTVFFLLCATFIPNGFNVFSIIFLADIPHHHCLVPEVNLSQEWRNAIIPIEVVNGKEELSRCSRYRLDVVRNLSDQGYIPGRDVNVTELGQEGCLDGWSYSRDIYQSTIVTEFDLVCSEQWKQPLTSSLYLQGILCGSFFSGQLSDRFGRKPVLFTSMALQTLSAFVQVFSPSWTMFSIFHFIGGMTYISKYMVGFVLGTEIFTGNIRDLFTSLGVCLFFAFGYMMLPLVAYFIRDWKSLQLTVSLPGLLYIPLWWLIPESPRWLRSQGRVEEAEAILRHAAKKNNVQAPQVIFEDDDADIKSEHHSVVDLLRTSNIRITTAILCLMWLSLVTGYYGLSLNTSRLHGDAYMNCFVSAAVEVPAYIFSWVALKYLPRRLSLISTMLLGGLSLYFIQLVPQSLPALYIALEMLGKFGIAIAGAVMYPYTGELYPTVIRNTAMGVCSTVSRVGSSVAPFIMQLSE
ncbi:organic cation/carnitine transporter 2-like [Diretmus argenteus]